MSDSIFIQDGIIYYGKVANGLNTLDSQLNLNSLYQIHGNKVVRMHLYKSRHRIDIIYNKDAQVIIELDKENDMSKIQNAILSSFHNARLLSTDRAKFYLIQKPLIAIGVLIFMILIIKCVEPNSNATNGSRLTTQAIMDLLRGFATLGMPKVVMIFGSLMIIPLLSIVLKLKTNKDISIIEFKTK